MLRDAIYRSCQERERQVALLCMYNRQDRATYNLLKEQGLFLFSHLLKLALKNLPKSYGSKLTMIKMCKTYYRGNSTELENIDDFERTYRPSDAIPWFTREIFLHQ